MPNAKVLINTQLGTVELEGEDSFVRTYLDIFIPIIEQAQLGSGSAVQATGDPSTDEAGLAKPRIRQRGPQTPWGESCRDRIRELRDEGFFTEQRGISDIVRGLNTRGHPHNVNQVGAALTTMFERNEILRTPVMGKFKYHWDAEERSAAAGDVING